MQWNNSRLKYKGFWVLRVVGISVSKVLERNRGDYQNVPHISRIDTEIAWSIDWMLFFYQIVKESKDFIWCADRKIITGEPSEIYAKVCDQEKPWQNASKI